MAKVSQHFEFSTPITNNGVHVGDISICGVGYKKDGELDYDIDEVFYTPKGGLPVQIPIQAIEFFMNDAIKEDDRIHNLCMEHMEYLFSNQQTREAA